jgi:hypothetical protein
MRHIIPIKSINTISVAEYFVKYIFKLHRLPNLIISNCGSQFVLDFWQALYKQLNIQIRLLTTFYLKTDG